MNRGALLVGLALCLSCEPKRVRTARDVDPLDPAIVARLDAAAASERMHAAFQLGQLGVSWDDVSVRTQVAAEDRLLRRLGVERDDHVRREIIAALGRVARTGSVLCEEVARPGPTRADAGWALVQLYRRRVGPAAVPLDPSGDIDTLGRALLTPEADVRAAVTGALAASQSAAARPLLVRELSDVDALARVEATRGLIALATADDLAALARVVHDRDERVAANAAVAIGVLAEKNPAGDQAIDLLTHEVAALARPAVLLALEEVGFVQPRWAPLFAKLEVLFEVGGQARVACLAALAHDRALGRVERIDHCTGLDDVTRARYAARALAEADPKGVPVDALLAVSTNDRDARGSILEGLARYDDAKSAHAVVAGVADPDLVVSSSAADAASTRKLVAAGPPLLARVAAIAQHAAKLGVEEAGTLPSLLAAIAVLRPAGGADVLRPFLDGTPAAVALGARDAMKAYGQPVLIHPTPPIGRYDGDALADHVVVRLDTDRGVIRMELDPAHAPRNARNFAGLVRTRFYDGLTFHRVVPGFVAQGGDPRGDGTGGADGLVACEPNDLPYREGTVGMALSGPDTGSSQFFITLAPAPRLEGRYTAFARVIEGMDAARALEPGDHIKTARIEEPR